jgi:Type I phosphodiesterase / nucleotide pyrophosphatase
MRFLRLLTNSLLAGALGAAYLTILVLQLNPQVPLASASVWRWYATLGAFYGIHLAVLFYATILLRELVSVRLFSPGWISVRLLAWLSAVAAAVAAVLMWLNLAGFPTLFDDADARRFAYGAIATTVSAFVLLFIAIAHYSFGRRGSRVGAALLVIAIVGSLALPLAARGPGGALPLGARRIRLTEPPPRRDGAHVTLILLDGGSLEYVWPRVAAGRLPNFGRVLDRGASMDLATIRPTQPGPVWATVSTGMYPAKNGVRSASLYFARGDDRPVDLLPDHCFSHTLVRLGVVVNEPATSVALRARPLWAILDDYGISSGIVRWPLTYPANPVSGFLVTDRFHQMIGSMLEFDARAVYPADLLPLLRESFESNPPKDPLTRTDELYSRAVRDLAAARPVQVAAVRYEGLDTAGHEDVDGVPFGMLDRYYAYIDAQIGAAFDRLAPGDLLLVVSGFGMEPVTPLEHAAARILRDQDASGTHDHAPDGFLLAYGRDVEPGRKQRGSIVDVTPTILYFLGVPIGRDMDGFARADVFASAFTGERPIAYIPSHGR